MKQHTFSILLLIITTTMLLVEQTTASCGVCGSNGIACISETEFHLCFNGQPDRSNIQKCPNNGICTSLRIKCSEAENAPADCQPLSCGCTADSGMFVCTSRTTYAQCNGGVTVATGTCPAGLTCAASRRGEICVDDCLLEGQIECDRAAPTN